MRPSPSFEILRRAPLFAAVVLLGVVTSRAADSLPPPRGTDRPLDLKQGDRVILLGDRLIEGEQEDGWIELMLTTRFADRDIVFRNFGWSADTPGGESHVGRSPVQTGKEPPGEGWTQLVRQLEEISPTVAIINYGMANSSEGDEGLSEFKAAYGRLVDTLTRISPQIRIVLLGPIRHENLGSPWPDPSVHNRQIESYSRASAEVAASRKLEFVSLFDALASPMEKNDKLTDNGVHLRSSGYRRLAEALEEHWYAAPGTWRSSPQSESLRLAIVRKNKRCFHRFRPENLAYIFGYRIRDQGKISSEVFKFDQLIAEDERRIAKLRSLTAQIVHESERPVSDLGGKHPEQPRPILEVAEGFEVSLWAETPLLNKPVQMNFDPQGRLWVATSEAYPQVQPGQVATDKIIVLEDTTGEGRADKATVFADGLLIPTGIAPGDGGVYVAQGNDLLFFKDTTGRGKADLRRTVLSGFGTEDTHHNLHTLRWGPDSRLYMNQSRNIRSNLETPHGIVRIKGSGIFRFDPRDEKLEVMVRGLINPWGHVFDRYGQSFLTDGAGFNGVAWVMPGATYRGYTAARRTLQTISLGDYPKFCGLAIIHTPLFPADWQGDLITCDFRAHRVVRFKIHDQGSGYVTEEMPHLLRSTNSTFRPIDAIVGPDGALYLADWSNPIIQHGEVDFRDSRRDKEYGRIWRIAAKGAPPLRWSDRSKRTNLELLDGLISPSAYEQHAARRVLTERGVDLVLSDLTSWTKAHSDNDMAKLSALWIYQSLNQHNPTLAADLLRSVDAGIRASAVRTLPTDGSLPALAVLVADENPRVRLEAVRSLAKVSNARAAELALSVLDRPMDPFLDYALWLTINELAVPWLAALKSGEWQIAGREAQLEFGLKAVQSASASEVLGQVLARKPIERDGRGPWIELIGTAGGPDLLRQMLDQLLRGEFSDNAAVNVLTSLRSANRVRGVRPTGDLAPIASFFESPNEHVRVAALKLAGTWKLSHAGTSLLAIARTPAVSSRERTAVFSALRELGDVTVLDDLRLLARSATTAALRREAALTLAAIDLVPSLAEIIAALKASPDDDDAQLFWRGLLGTSGVSAKLVAELPDSGLPPNVARAGLHPAREGGQHQALVAVLMKIGGAALSTVKSTPLEMEALANAALVKGDAERGEQVYRRADLACMVCHAIGGAGGHVGPDLASIGSSAPVDYLVESLLFPNAKIKEGYNALLISTKDGQEISGTNVGETPTEITLRNAANQEVSISMANIAKRTSLSSLMPEGLVDSLLPGEFIDLIKFLSSLGKPGDYDATKGGVALSWKIYQVVNNSQHLGAERVIAGDFSLDGWRGVLSRVGGALTNDVIKSVLPSLKKDRRGLFVATRFDCGNSGSATFSLSGEASGVWVNGAAVKPSSRFTVQAKRGPNIIVLQLDEGNLPEAIKLASDDVSFSSP